MLRSRDVLKLKNCDGANTVSEHTHLSLRCRDLLPLCPHTTTFLLNTATHTPTPAVHDLRINTEATAQHLIGLYTCRASTIVLQQSNIEYRCA